MEKNRRKVIRKIKRFYQRDNKVKYHKMTNEMLNDTSFSTLIINSLKSKVEKKQNWIRNIKVKIGVCKDDYVKNRQTVAIFYTYPKYGNL